MIVVNLYGGPAAGKSTVAMGLAHLLKMQHLKVEYVDEYAKSLTLEQRENILKRDQLYIFAKQHRRLQRLDDAGCDIAVTDSPLMLTTVYFDERANRYPPTLFRRLVLGTARTYENWNFFLLRDPDNPYQQFGRTQDEKGAIAQDQRIKDTLHGFGIRYDELVSNKKAVPVIFDVVMDRVAEKKRRAA